MAQVLTMSKLPNGIPHKQRHSPDTRVEKKEAVFFREDSGISDISALTDDEEGRKLSSNSADTDYNFVEGAKVLGVHKQERPKVTFLFVIIVRWSDKSQVTIYRKWKEIKELQDELLKEFKNNPKASESRRYLKKTAQSVRRATRFQKGTVKKLNMIDSLNQFFEALVHFKESAVSSTSRRFFKPNDIDLSSISWSGDGRTYFYVTRDVLGERNKGYENDDEENDCDEEAVSVTDSLNSPVEWNAGGVSLKQADQELNDALEKYCEADPNITWPIKSSVHVSLCDFDATDEDPKQNIISLFEGEEVDVLDRNECGWWLVSRVNEETKSKDGVGECGYVPASYLSSKEIQEIPRLSVTSDEGTVFLNRNSEKEARMTSLPSNISFSSISEEEFEPSTFYSMGDNQGEYEAETSSDEMPSPPILRCNPTDSFDFTASEENLSSRASTPVLLVPDFSTNNSPSSSLESLQSYPETPIPKPRRKKIACIEARNAHLAECRTSSFSSLRPRALSGVPGIQTKPNFMTPVAKRRHTSALQLGFTGSTPDLRKRQSMTPNNSPSLSRNSSLLSVTKKGIDYISIKEYIAASLDELSFNEGAIIRVLSKNSNGWWLASYQGRTGLVPGVHLTRYRDPIRKLSLHVLDMM